MYEPTGQTSPTPPDSKSIKHAGFDFDDTFWPQKYASEMMFQALYQKVADVSGEPYADVVKEALRVVRTMMAHEMPDYIDQMAKGDSPVAKGLAANLGEVKSYMREVEDRYVQTVAGAVEAVKMLEEEGVQTFIFSEANGETLSQRLKMMGFDGVIGRAYSAMMPTWSDKDPDEPLTFTLAEPRDEAARMVETPLFASNSLSPKDDSDNGWGIALAHEGVDADDYDQTIIVGDNLVRDVARAKDLGVVAVQADATLVLDERPNYAVTDPNQFRKHRPLETQAAADPDVVIRSMVDLIANFRGPNAKPEMHDPVKRVAAFEARLAAAMADRPANANQADFKIDRSNEPDGGAGGPRYRAA